MSLGTTQYKDLHNEAPVVRVVLKIEIYKDLHNESPVVRVILKIEIYN